MTAQEKAQKKLNRLIAFLTANPPEGLDRADVEVIFTRKREDILVLMTRIFERKAAKAARKAAAAASSLPPPPPPPAIAIPRAPVQVQDVEISFYDGYTGTTPFRIVNGREAFPRAMISFTEPPNGSLRMSRVTGRSMTGDLVREYYGVGGPQQLGTASTFEKRTSATFRMEPGIYEAVIDIKNWKRANEQVTLYWFVSKDGHVNQIKDKQSFDNHLAQAFPQGDVRVTEAERAEAFELLVEYVSQLTELKNSVKQALSGNTTSAGPGFVAYEAVKKASGPLIVKYLDTRPELARAFSYIHGQPDLKEKAAQEAVHRAWNRAAALDPVGAAAPMQQAPAPPSEDEEDEVEGASVVGGEPTDDSPLPTDEDRAQAIRRWRQEALTDASKAFGDATHWAVRSPGFRSELEANKQLIKSLATQLSLHNTNFPWGVDDQTDMREDTRAALREIKEHARDIILDRQRLERLCSVLGCAAIEAAPQSAPSEPAEAPAQLPAASRGRPPQLYDRGAREPGDLVIMQALHHKDGAFDVYFVEGKTPERIDMRSFAHVFKTYNGMRVLHVNREDYASILSPNGTHSIDVPELTYAKVTGTKSEQANKRKPKGLEQLQAGFEALGIGFDDAAVWSSVGVLVDGKPKLLTTLLGVLKSAPGSHHLRVLRRGLYHKQDKRAPFSSAPPAPPARIFKAETSPAEPPPPGDVALTVKAAAMRFDANDEAGAVRMLAQLFDEIDAFSTMRNYEVEAALVNVFKEARIPEGAAKATARKLIEDAAVAYTENLRAKAEAARPARPDAEPPQAIKLEPSDKNIDVYRLPWNWKSTAKGPLLAINLSFTLRAVGTDEVPTVKFTPDAKGNPLLAVKGALARVKASPAFRRIEMAQGINRTVLEVHTDSTSISAFNSNILLAADALKQIEEAWAEAPRVSASAANLPELAFVFDATDEAFLRRLKPALSASNTQVAASILVAAFRHHGAESDRRVVDRVLGEYRSRLHGEKQGAEFEDAELMAEQQFIASLGGGENRGVIDVKAEPAPAQAAPAAPISVFDAGDESRLERLRVELFAGNTQAAVQTLIEALRVHGVIGKGANRKIVGQVLGEYRKRLGSSAALLSEFEEASEIATNQHLASLGSAKDHGKRWDLCRGRWLDDGEEEWEPTVPKGLFDDFSAADKARHQAMWVVLRKSVCDESVSDDGIARLARQNLRLMNKAKASASGPNQREAVGDAIDLEGRKPMQELKKAMLDVFFGSEGPQEEPAPSWKDEEINFKKLPWFYTIRTDPERSIALSFAFGDSKAKSGISYPKGDTLLSLSLSGAKSLFERSAIWGRVNRVADELDLAFIISTVSVSILALNDQEKVAADAIQQLEEAWANVPRKNAPAAPIQPPAPTEPAAVPPSAPAATSAPRTAEKITTIHLNFVDNKRPSVSENTNYSSQLALPGVVIKYPSWFRKMTRAHVTPAGDFVNAPVKVDELPGYDPSDLSFDRHSMNLNIPEGLWIFEGRTRNEQPVSFYILSKPPTARKLTKSEYESEMKDLRYEGEVRKREVQREKNSNALVGRPEDHEKVDLLYTLDDFDKDSGAIYFTDSAVKGRPFGDPPRGGSIFIAGRRARNKPVELGEGVSVVSGAFLPMQRTSTTSPPTLGDGATGVVLRVSGFPKAWAAGLAEGYPHSVEIIPHVGDYTPPPPPAEDEAPGMGVVPEPEAAEEGELFPDAPEMDRVRLNTMMTVLRYLSMDEDDNVTLPDARLKSVALAIHRALVLGAPDGWENYLPKIRAVKQVIFQSLKDAGLVTERTERAVAAVDGIMRAFAYPKTITIEDPSPSYAAPTASSPVEAPAKDRSRVVANIHVSDRQFQEFGRNGYWWARMDNAGEASTKQIFKKGRPITVKGSPHVYLKPPLMSDGLPGNESLNTIVQVPPGTLLTVGVGKQRDGGVQMQTRTVSLVEGEVVAPVESRAERQRRENEEITRKLMEARAEADRRAAEEAEKRRAAQKAEVDRKAADEKAAAQAKLDAQVAALMSDEDEPAAPAPDAEIEANRKTMLDMADTLTRRLGGTPAPLEAATPPAPRKPTPQLPPAYVNPPAQVTQRSESVALMPEEWFKTPTQSADGYYRYGLIHRGAMPKGFMELEPKLYSIPSETRYGIVAYTRPQPDAHISDVLPYKGCRDVVDFVIGRAKYIDNGIKEAIRQGGGSPIKQRIVLRKMVASLFTGKLGFFTNIPTMTAIYVIVDSVIPLYSPGDEIDKDMWREAAFEALQGEQSELKTNQLAKGEESGERLKFDISEWGLHADAPWTYMKIAFVNNGNKSLSERHLRIAERLTALAPNGVSEQDIGWLSTRINMTVERTKKLTSSKDVVLGVRYYLTDLLSQYGIDGEALVKDSILAEVEHQGGWAKKGDGAKGLEPRFISEVMSSPPDYSALGISRLTRREDEILMRPAFVPPPPAATVTEMTYIPATDLADLAKGYFGQTPVYVTLGNLARILHQRWYKAGVGIDFASQLKVAHDVAVEYAKARHEASVKMNPDYASEYDRVAKAAGEVALAWLGAAGDARLLYGSENAASEPTLAWLWTDQLKKYMRDRQARMTPGQRPAEELELADKIMNAPSRVEKPGDAFLQAGSPAPAQRAPQLLAAAVKASKAPQPPSAFIDEYSIPRPEAYPVFDARDKHWTYAQGMPRIGDVLVQGHGGRYGYVTLYMVTGPRRESDQRPNFVKLGSYNDLGNGNNEANFHSDIPSAKQKLRVPFEVDTFRKAMADKKSPDKVPQRIPKKLQHTINLLGFKLPPGTGVWTRGADGNSDPGGGGFGSAFSYLSEVPPPETPEFDRLPVLTQAVLEMPAKAEPPVFEAPATLGHKIMWLRKQAEVLLPLLTARGWKVVPHDSGEKIEIDPKGDYPETFILVEDTKSDRRPVDIHLLVPDTYLFAKLHVQDESGLPEIRLPDEIRDDIELITPAYGPVSDDPAVFAPLMEALEWVREVIAEDGVARVKNEVSPSRRFPPPPSGRTISEKSEVELRHDYQDRERAKRYHERLMAVRPNDYSIGRLQALPADITEYEMALDKKTRFGTMDTPKPAPTQKLTVPKAKKPAPAPAPPTPPVEPPALAKDDVDAYRQGMISGLDGILSRLGVK